MNLLSKASKCCQTLINTSKNTYHVLSLLQSKNQSDLIKINPQLFHLYLYKLTHQPFNERYALTIIMDCYRTSQSAEQFSIIVQYALSNLQRFTSRISLVTLLNQMYLYRYQNKDEVTKVMVKALSIPQAQDSSYFNLKLLIAFNYLVGLQALPQASYRAINFNKFRPLTLTMVIQLFFTRNLQKQYKLVQQLIDIFVECQSFVPFADVHHLAYAIRRIDNVKFKQCFYRIRKRIQASVGGKDDLKMQLKQEQKQLQNLQKSGSAKPSGKKENVCNIWTTQQELMQRFKQLITQKYNY